MDLKQVMDLFPELLLVDDENLRKHYAEVAPDAITAGGWDQKGVHKCPAGMDEYLLRCPVNLVMLTRRMTGVANALYQGMGEWANGYSACDHDTAVAGAFLQGIGKFMEFDLDAYSKPCYSGNGRLFRHPASGAWLAMEKGLSLKIVHIVVSTSPEYSPGKGKVESTPESLIVKNAELICMTIIDSLFKKF